MKIQEFTIRRPNGSEQKIEQHLKYDEVNGNFCIAEIDAATKEVEVDIRFEWPEAEKIERFLRSKREEAEEIESETRYLSQCIASMAYEHHGESGEDCQGSDRS